MVMKREGGYTLVEIGLVMAVSAGLLLIAGSLYTMSGNQRFTDSLQTTRTFIQQQYNDVRSNISQRVGGDVSSLCAVDPHDLGDKSAGNNKSCLLMGKIIQFKDDRMKSSYIIGKPPVGSDWPNANKTAVENIRDMTLFAITSPSAGRGVRPTEKLYPNGGEAITTLACNDKECSRGEKVKTPSDEANLVILRSPLDGSILTFAYAKLVGNDDTSKKISDIGSNSYLGLVLALRSGGLGVSTGSLCIPVASTSSGIQTAAPAEGLNGSGISNSKTLFSVCSVEVD